LNGAQRKQLFAAMQLDKKVSGGEVKFVLAGKIGRVKYGCKIPAPLIEQALDA
jgi:3-dehydroquinate synthetase